MDLHAEIMNIQTDRVRMIDQLNLVSDYNTAYKVGHRDARHAAAELALKAQTRIEGFEFLLEQSLEWLDNYEDCHGKPEEVALLAQIIRNKLK